MPARETLWISSRLGISALPIFEISFGKILDSQPSAGRPRNVLNWVLKPWAGRCPRATFPSARWCFGSVQTARIFTCWMFSTVMTWMFTSQIDDFEFVALEDRIGPAVAVPVVVSPVHRWRRGRRSPCWSRRPRQVRPWPGLWSQGPIGPPVSHNAAASKPRRPPAERFGVWADSRRLPAIRGHAMPVRQPTPSSAGGLLFDYRRDLPVSQPVRSMG